MRDRLATSIGTVLCRSDRRHRQILAIAPESVCVEAARAELQALSEMLGGGSFVYARGVAMTKELLQSAESPLFDPREAESASCWAQLSMSALQGHI